MMQKLKSILKKNKWLTLSMIATFFTAIFLGSFLLLYTQFQTATLRSIAQVNQGFVDRVEVVNAATLSSIKTSAMQMFYTSSIHTLRTTNELSNSSKITGLRDLGNFVSSSDFLDSVLVYNGNLDLIFSSEGIYPPMTSGTFPDISATHLLTQHEDNLYLMPLKRETSTGTCYSFLFYDIQAQSSSALLLNVNARWYETALFGLSPVDSYLIFDHAGDLIASTDSQLSAHFQDIWPTIQAQQLEHPDTRFFIPTGFRADTGWMYHHIANSDWHYLEILDLESIAPGLLHMRTVILVFFLLFSLAFIVSAGFMLLKVLLPMIRIRQALKEYAHPDQALSSRVKSLVEFQKESAISRELPELKSGILPESFHFPVLLLIADSSNLQAIKELLCTVTPHTMSMKDGTGIFSALHTCQPEILQEIHSALEQRPGTLYYVGELCHSKDQLIKSYSALDELRHLRMLYPDISIFQQSLLDQCHPTTGLNTKDVTALTTALKAGDYQTADHLWHAIFQSIQRDRYGDFYYGVRYLNKQLALLHADLGLDKPSSLTQLLDSITHTQPLHQYFKAQLTTLSNGYAWRKNKQLSDLSAQVDCYIHQHYMDASFSTHSLAAHFEMNAAYLARQYAKTAGKSLNDSINSIRVGYACKLLAQTSQSAEAISSRVGFANSKYFFVLFKKWTGMTPTQYRIAQTESL